MSNSTGNTNTTTETKLDNSKVFLSESPTRNRSSQKLRNLKNLLMRLDYDVGWEIQLGIEKSQPLLQSPAAKRKKDREIESKLVSGSTFSGQIENNTFSSLKRYKILDEDKNGNTLFILGNFPETEKDLKSWICSSALINAEFNITRLLHSFWSTFLAGGLITNYSKKQTNIHWINLNSTTPLLSSNSQKFLEDENLKLEKALCHETARLCFKSFNGFFWSLDDLLCTSFKDNFDFFTSPFFVKSLHGSSENIFKQLKEAHKSGSAMASHCFKLFTRYMVHRTAEIKSLYLNSTIGSAELSPKTQSCIDETLEADHQAITVNARFFNLLNSTVDSNKLSDSIEHLSEQINELLDFSSWRDLDFSSNLTLSNTKIVLKEILPSYPWFKGDRNFQVIPTSWFVEIGYIDQNQANLLQNSALVVSITEADFITGLVNLKNDIQGILVPAGNNIYSISLLSQGNLEIESPLLDSTSKLDTEQETAFDELAPIGSDHVKCPDLDDLKFGLTRVNTAPGYKDHQPFPISSFALFSTSYLNSSNILRSLKYKLPFYKYLKTLSVEKLTELNSKKKLILDDLLVFDNPNTDGLVKALDPNTKQTCTDEIEICQIDNLQSNNRIDSRSVLSFLNPDKADISKHSLKTFGDWYHLYYPSLLKDDEDYGTWNVAFDHLEGIQKTQNNFDEIKSKILLNSEEFERPYMGDINESLLTTGHKSVFARLRFEHIASMLKSYNHTSDSRISDSVMAKEAKIQILLHLFVLSHNATKDKHLVSKILSGEDLGGSENTTTLVLNYYFDRLCIYSSLNFYNDQAGSKPNSSRDTVEDFLTSLPVLRFRQNLGSLIDSLLERNGFIVPTTSLDVNTASPFLDSFFSEHDLHPKLDILGKSHESNFVGINQLATPAKRKGKPKKIVASPSSKNTEFLISPSKSWSNKLIPTPDNNKSSSIQNKSNLGLGISEPRMVSNKKLARYSSSRIHRFGSLNNVKPGSVDPPTSKKQQTSSASIESRLLELSRLSNAPQTTLSGAGRRSSGRIVSHLKQKIRSEVLFSTSSQSPGLNKGSSSTKELEDIGSEVPSNPFLNAKNSINGLNSMRFSSGYLKIPQPRAITAKAISRYPSAPAIRVEPFEVQEATINRSLRRKERFSSSLLFQRISSNIEKDSESICSKGVSETTDTNQALHENSKSLNHQLESAKAEKKSNVDLNRLFFDASNVLKSKEIDELKEKAGLVDCVRVKSSRPHSSEYKTGVFYPSKLQRHK